MPSTVEINVPAEPLYVSLLRTSAANLLSHNDFNIDDIEDMRVGISEVAALLLENATPGTMLRTVFTSAPDRVSAEFSVDTNSLVDVDTTSFAWAVLSALLDNVSFKYALGTLTIHFSKEKN